MSNTATASTTNAYNAVLTWCRRQTQENAHFRPCMRTAQDGACLVVDVNRSELSAIGLVTGCKVLARGASWLDCAAALGIAVAA